MMLQHKQRSFARTDNVKCSLIFSILLLFVPIIQDSKRWGCHGQKISTTTTSTLERPSTTVRTVTSMIESTDTVTQRLPGGYKYYPSRITLRGGVIEDHPFSFITEHPNHTYSFSGFEIDFLDRMKAYAKDDGIELNFILSPAPSKYNEAYNLVSNDCNTTVNPNTREDCDKFDMIIGDYFSNPSRYARADFTPAWLTATMTSVRYLDKDPSKPDYGTVGEADRAGARVCLLDGTYVTRTTIELWPSLNVLFCQKQADCAAFLKNESCVLWVDDSTQLAFRVTQDSSLGLTRETFKPQYFVWPMKFEIPQVIRYLISRWTYLGTSTGDLGDLYHKYFEQEICPVGTAGENCELFCHADHGRADKRGKCVCESTKWKGSDCSIEVLEDKNLIPSNLKMTGYVMFVINVVLCVGCAIWLVVNRKAPEVAVAQPFFLGLVLVGCMISSSAILALAAEDEGDGPVHACMAIPWLYSIGFSITFGSLFAKILRVHKIFKSASEMRRKEVTIQETVYNILGVLFVDIIILVIWTIFDPLEWTRHIQSADKFGEPLSSVGFCTSNHWHIFAGLIAGLHFIVLSIACYVCYITRNISDRLAEGKYVAMAMVSNFQILLVGFPVLFIIGADPHTSFFVRSVIIWMNDFVVVCLIFGNIMYAARANKSGQTRGDLVRTSIRNYLGSQSRARNPTITRLNGSSRFSNADQTAGFPTKSMIDEWENEPENGGRTNRKPRSGLLDVGPPPPSSGCRSAYSRQLSNSLRNSDKNLQSSQGSFYHNRDNNDVYSSDNQNIKSLQEENTRLLALLGTNVLRALENSGVSKEELFSSILSSSSVNSNGSTGNRPTSTISATDSNSSSGIDSESSSNDVGGDNATATSRTGGGDTAKPTRQSGISRSSLDIPGKYSQDLTNDVDSEELLLPASPASSSTTKASGETENSATRTITDNKNNNDNV